MPLTRSASLTLGLRVKLQRISSARRCGMRLGCNIIRRKLNYFSFISIGISKVPSSTQNFAMLSYLSLNSANKSCKQEGHQTCKTCSLISRCFLSIQESSTGNSGSNCFSLSSLWSRNANYSYRIHTLMFRKHFRFSRQRVTRVNQTASSREMTCRGHLCSQTRI